MTPSKNTIKIQIHKELSIMVYFLINLCYIYRMFQVFSASQSWFYFMLTSNCAFHIAAPRVIVANGLNLLAGAGTVESRLMLQMPETFIVIIRQLLNSNTAGK